MRLELIELIYKTVDDIERWPQFIDTLLADSIFVASAVGYQHTMRDIMMTGVFRGADEEHTERLYSEIIPNNPLMMTGLVLSYGSHVLMDDEVLPRHIFERSDYYQWMDEIGADRILIGVHRDEPDGAVHFPCYVKRGAEVTPAHLADARAILPHLAQALELSRKMAQLKAMCGRSLGALDSAHFGCILINQNRKVEWMNQYAEAILSRGDALLVRQNELIAAQQGQRQALREHIDAALGLNLGHVTTPKAIHRLNKDEGYLDLLVSALSPFGHPILEGRTGALIMLADPDYLEEGISGRLESLYGLSPAEAEVTQWLLSGSSVDEIARIFGKSEHTVRYQLKNVMKKCNVSSQAQLVGLIHRGVACLS